MMEGRTSHESLAMLRMWRSVAAAAIIDAAKEITGSHGSARETAIAHHSRYFHGRDWREICDTAGITCKPDAVMRFLTSDKAMPTAQKCMVSLGLVEFRGKERESSE